MSQTGPVFPTSTEEGLPTSDRKDECNDLATGDSYRVVVSLTPTDLAPVGCPSGSAVLDRLLPALGKALAGSGPALVPVPDGPVGEAVKAMADPSQPLEQPETGRVVLVVPTSGSTGQPRGALLTDTALAAAATAAHARLGGNGSWLLCLPTTHIAGLQILTRSLFAGTTPVCQDLTGGFTAAGFVEAARRLPTSSRRYTSLIPTQLARLLDDESATGALRGFDTVLLGGAPTPDALLDRARAAGIAVMTTYGMSETCGGCVYDGRPLDGVTAATGDGGRITLSGAVLFSGYRRDPAATAAVLRNGVFTTTDLGHIDGSGRLSVRGRADAVIRSGGESVSPEAVERVLTGMPGVSDALVVGVPDIEWGQRVVALVRWEPGAEPAPERARRLVAGRLGRAAVPRDILDVTELPHLGIGKPDRGAATRLAENLLATTDLHREEPPPAPGPARDPTGS